jgi:hypothetical protein
MFLSNITSWLAGLTLRLLVWPLGEMLNRL